MELIASRAIVLGLALLLLWNCTYVYRTASKGDDRELRAAWVGWRASQLVVVAATLWVFVTTVQWFLES